MKINPLNIPKLNLNNQLNYTRTTYNNLKPLSYDSVSFGKMKKSEFEGVDLLVVNKFKAPIEKFKSNDDFQKWCGEKIEELKEKDLEARKKETTTQRRETLKEWVDYLFDENSDYTNSIILLIFNDFFKDLKHDNDKVIPPLNKKILSDTVKKISKEKGDINFKKEYKTALQNMSLDNLETHLDENKTGWVIVPSVNNSPNNFEENIDKLKTLSYKNWSTASFGARGYLLKGDFYIYLKNGHPELGMRFVGDEIKEIQGKKNNGKIPVEYLDAVSECVKDKKLSYQVYCEFQRAEKIKNRINEVKNKLEEQGVDIASCSAQQLLNALDIDYEVDKDGLLILYRYEQPDRDYTFEDLGINENALLRNVKEIKGNADFSNSQATDLGNLQYIGGNALFIFSQIQSLGKLKHIGGSAYFCNSQITSLGDLETIGGTADFEFSQVLELERLKSIGKSAIFRESKITSLKGLQSIGEDANFSYSWIKDLGNLEIIGGDVQLGHTLHKKAFKNVKIKGHIL